MATILLVEDSTVFRKAFKQALLSYFPALRIEEAAEGVRALEVVRERCPHLIFMDVNLPGENGLELTRKIKQLCPQTKVIILTALPVPGYREAAAAAGANYVTLKGVFQMEDIVSLIRKLNLA